MGAAAGQTLAWNGSTWAPTTPVSPVSNNIYNIDGTLTGNRTVTQGGSSLTFSGTGNLIKTAGQFGIGTTTPTGIVHVVQNSNQLRLDFGVNNALLQLQPSSTANWSRIGSAGSPIAFMTNGANDKTDWNPAMIIKPNGTVAIGGSTATDEGRVSIESNLVKQAALNYSANMLYFVRPSSRNNSTGVSNYQNANMATFKLGSYDASTTQSHSLMVLEMADGATNTPDRKLMSWQANGFVGLNTDNPLHNFDVIGDVSVRERLEINDVAGNLTGMLASTPTTGTGGVENGIRLVCQRGNGKIMFEINDGAGPLERMRIISNGNVGIGTTAPTQKLHVIGNILASGTITPSDARFKENINTLTGSLVKLNQLRGVSYTHKATFIKERGLSDGNQIGFIAQELEKVFPEFVVTSTDGYKAVDYARLTPVLVESLKEVNAKLEAQQAEINELKAAVKQLMEKK